jgi:hypothetical protein
LPPSIAGWALSKWLAGAGYNRRPSLIGISRRALGANKSSIFRRRGVRPEYPEYQEFFLLARLLTVYLS